jgi:hypothetical protein
VPAHAFQASDDQRDAFNLLRRCRAEIAGRVVWNTVPHWVTWT